MTVFYKLAIPRFRARDDTSFCNVGDEKQHDRKKQSKMLIGHVQLEATKKQECALL